VLLDLSAAATLCVDEGEHLRKQLLFFLGKVVHLLQVLLNRIGVFAGSGTARVAQATSTCFWECVGGLGRLWQAVNPCCAIEGLLSIGRRSSASVLSLGFVAMLLSWITANEY
jgi:hypothetical protein